MKTKFNKSAELPLDLTIGDQTITLKLKGPPLGWRDQLDAAFPKPVGGFEGRPGKEPLPLPATDEQIEAYNSQKSYLCIGKVLALSGELDAVYPDPLPKKREELVALAGQVERELIDAGLIDGHIIQLTEAYMRLTLGAVYDQAKAAGNASRQSAAT